MVRLEAQGSIRWNELTSVEQLDEIRKQSEKKPVLIYKHSTRCSTSHLVLDRLERNWRGEGIPGVEMYFLDLLSHRNVSNAIAEVFGVEHESPQVLIIEGGKAVYDRSHLEIDYKSISAAIRS